jgi:hypothetical protein
MRAPATGILIAMMWLTSTGPSLSQSGGVFQFDPFQIPIFGGAQPPPGGILWGPNFDRTRSTTSVGSRKSPTARAEPSGARKSATPGQSLNDVINSSRIKF